MLMEILAGVLLLTAIGLVSGGGLVLSSRRWAHSGDEVARLVNKLLPQTQCAQCGYPGCRPYAEAITRGDADINQCPPGGAVTIVALAELLGRDPKPLDRHYGTLMPKQVAVIDEAVCIGCFKCIQVCPVDAILGAPKQMHAVIASECTGCELCIVPCPVDCISMTEVNQGIASWRWPRSQDASRISL